MIWNIMYYGGMLVMLLSFLAPTPMIGILMSAVGGAVAIAGAIAKDRKE